MNSLPPLDSTFSAIRTRISNRLARQFLAAPLALANPTPMVSFTFDDIPDTAATVAAPMIEDHGGRATFYVAGGLVGSYAGFWHCATAEQILDLHRSGHEIGCHTFGHRRLGDIDKSEMVRDFEANRRLLQSLDPSMHLSNFAYPYGAAAIERKASVRRLFRSARSVHPGINAGTVDRHYLWSLPLISVLTDAAAIDRALDETIRNNGWLIFYGHDIAERPTNYGCTPDLLRYAVATAVRRQLAIVTMTDALNRAGA